MPEKLCQQKRGSKKGALALALPHFLLSAWKVQERMTSPPGGCDLPLGNDGYEQEGRVFSSPINRILAVE
jgi:hypothetical protein